MAGLMSARSSLRFPGVLLLLALSAAFGQDFKRQVIYQIITDRFVNGTTDNDNPPQSAGLFDATRTNWSLYWGGDLTGIQQKLAYLKGMGITAIWISPPVDNINIASDPTHPSAPYHGYSARDFKRIEEHYGDSNNGWAEFDNLVAAAHQNGIKIIVDFAANHTSPERTAEKGALYDSGTLIASYDNDPKGVFHHTSDLSSSDDYKDRYKVQYWSIFSLADLNQENPVVDSYLKAALHQLQQHGVDAFRMDAVKHVTWGWEYSEVNSIFSNGPSFVFGEWMGGRDDALYHDAYKFANKSGMSLLDYPLYYSITNVFANDNPFSEIDGTLSAESREFVSPNDLVTFIDNHDKPRLLTIRNNLARLDEATAFVLTCRGIPIIYYGDEQYLHNDTSNGSENGGDPYNRPWMASFDTSTKEYKLISRLADLRQTNAAVAYGTMQQRWINADVYIYERKFFEDVVMVAINKSDSASYNISGLFTALPSGTYQDYLTGLMSGMSINVGNGQGNNPVTTFTMPPHTVAVWQSKAAATSPEVASIGPTVGQPSMNVTIAGKGFGNSPGKILFGTAEAQIHSWSDTTVNFSVPNVPGGVYNVQLKTSTGIPANSIAFTVLTRSLIPVTFTVKTAIPTQFGDNIFLTGNTIELGNWGTTYDSAVGPMLAPEYPNWFIDAAVPVGTTIQFKFLRIASNGDVTWEGGPNHTYTVPLTGTAFVDVTWQK